jgi:purine-binding chemotaxis protein CheW
MQPQRRAEDPEKIALYEEDLYGEEELREETLQLVVFRLAQEWYGVEIIKVKEVIKVKTEKITYLPSSPEYIAGIINLRGNILSVTDLKRILGLPQENLTEKTRIVAIESGILETGLLVDEVAASLEVPVSKIELTLSTIAPEVAEYIEGQCKVDDKLIALLNVEKILERKGVDEESNR